jgi:two-component system chemotaxis sensor kinase CheA
MNLPPEFLERFRVLSLERVGRVENAWNRLVHEDEAEGLVRQMLREVHTLKGDASVVGAHEVLLLCQKLEDLLEVAEELRFEISEDLELVVTMAIQFLGMLLRMKAGAMTGLDLAGFVRQVEEVLRETRTIPIAPRLRRTTHRGTTSDAPIDRLSEPTRQRLAAAATTVFLEYLSARGTTSRTRLRGVWTTMRQELARMEVAELGPLLERHVASAHELARGLGKRAAIELELASTRVAPRVAEAVDIAVLHLIRNAIDHGIEPPAERVRAGKPEQGRVSVRATPRDANIEISVEDDGGGIDLAAVRATAIASGLLDAASTIDDAALSILVFEPGLSTRANVTQLSGRGVGMDVVKSTVSSVGGQVRIATSPSGTTVTLVVPALVRHLHAYQFLAPGGAVSLAVSARWTPSIESSIGDAIDPLHTIQLFGSSRQTSVEPPKPVREVAVRLRWGFLEVNLRAATEPRLVTAERICSTPDDHPVEVVVIDGQETLLLRPEHVTELAAAWRRPSVRAYDEVRPNT